MINSPATVKVMLPSIFENHDLSHLEIPCLEGITGMLTEAI